MSDYYFYAESAIHEGGSKYYQLIRLGSISAKRSVVVTHWAKMHPGAPSEPKHYGQHKTELVVGSGVAEARGHKSRKSKNGYRNWETKADCEFSSESELVAKIAQWFNAKDTTTIVTHLFGMTELVEPIGEGTYTEEYYYDAEAAAPVEAPKPKSEDWGTW